jgi:hypothetical protein
MHLLGIYETDARDHLYSATANLRCGRTDVAGPSRGKNSREHFAVAGARSENSPEGGS